MIRFCFLLLCLTCSSAFAQQKQNDIWNFGRGCSMYFNSGNFGSLIKTTGEDSVPPHAFQDFIFHIATMCDKNTGSLLFYSNGDKVLNRANQLMPNGQLGSGYASHIVTTPDASDSTQFFIFYTTNVPGIRYAKVDMTLDGGMGDVIEKDVVISADVGANFVVIKQYYDQGHWLVSHSLSNDSFYAFRIFGSKIYPPVASLTGPSMTVDGPITIDVKGELMALAYHTSKKNIGIYSFDKKCGKLTFSDSLDVGTTCYGLAFDVTSEYLYASSYNGGVYELYQYDVKSIPANPTKKTIGSTSSMGAQAAQYPLETLKLAPDNKIYITTEEMVGGGLSPASFLYAIYNPSFGSAPGFILQPAVQLTPIDKSTGQPKVCGGGPEPCYITNNLPDFVADRTQNNIPGSTNPDIQAESFCLGDSTLFTANKDFFADSVRWIFGNGESSNLLKAKTLYNDTGLYTVKFKWYACIFEYEDSMLVHIITKPVVNLGADATLCDGDSITLNAGDARFSYLWSTGDTTSTITVQQAGQYSVQVMSKGCENANDSINVDYYSYVPMTLKDEFTVCEDDNQPVTLDAGSGFHNYQWLPSGDTTQSIQVATPGVYYVTANDIHGCTSNDSTTVKRHCELQIYFPDAFTPNGDGVNEVYAPVGPDVVSFNMKIYNRWGQMIFETDDISKGWTGKVRDGYASPGVYVYYSNYSGYENNQLKNFQKKGQLTLLR